MLKVKVHTTPAYSEKHTVQTFNHVEDFTMTEKGIVLKTSSDSDNGFEFEKIGQRVIMFSWPAVARYDLIDE